MSMPNFLSAPSSPPRSPHVAVPGYFDQMMRQSQSSRGVVFKPTRRDILLCLLTLSFSYLLFSSPSTSTTTISHSDIHRQSSSEHNGYKMPWTGMFSGKESCPAPPVGSKETTFSESVRGFGLGGDESPLGSGKWDGGEEEAEDDEVFQGETVLAGHSPGWTMFEKLYVYNGSFYVVTHEREDWPELRMMTSTGLPANSEPGNGEAREPKGHEIIFIKPSEAAKLWGRRVYRMEGMTWLFNDGQFINHYYHFAAELLLGTWRVHASLDQDITPKGDTIVTPPRRIWFLHQDVNEWRDNPRFNPTILFALFPSISLLYPSDFQDIGKSSSSYLPNAFVMDKAILADRSAAFRGPYTGPTARTVAGALQVGKASRWWWEPIRRQMLRYSGVSESIIDRNLEGLGAVDPASREGTMIGPGITDLEPLSPPGEYVPLVTYISRQNSRRRLTPEAHQDLVKALEERSKKVGFELEIVEAEKLTKEEQIALAARTTIMLGVHGNGLTHLLWMPATPRSAVIEMFYQGGFARDYQWTTHALGMRHFAIQHDSVYTAPNTPEVAYPEGFQGTQITVVGKTVADLIEDRLNGKR